MRKAGFCLVMLLVLFVGLAQAEKITWINPVTYSDGSAISSTDQGTIKSRILIKDGAEADWTVVVTISYGQKSWTGALPSKYAPGTGVKIGVDSSLYGLIGAPMEVNYTIPTIAPSSPTDVLVVR